MFLLTYPSRFARTAAVLGVLATLLLGAIGTTAHAAAATKLFAATNNNTLWSRDAASYNANWKDIGHANHVTAMTGGGAWLSATADGRLFYRQPVKQDHERSMTDIDPPAGVVAMAYG